MKSPELKQQVVDTLQILIGSEDELGELDQQLGDGDLGITVATGSRAIIEALNSASDLDAPAIVMAAAKAFANANPSTFAALVAGGLLAGSKKIAGREELHRHDAAEFLNAFSESIAQRGKAELGDKTILDVIVPASRAMGEPGGSLNSALQTARDALAAITSLQSRRGRASWLQERSIGLQDPGATAFVRFLEAWSEAASHNPS